MATRIRLRREGRKGQSYFRIVVADSRSPRDGRFVALLGHYNPRTNPADIKVDAAPTTGSGCSASWGSRRGRLWNRGATISWPWKRPMLRINVVTLFPEVFEAALAVSIPGRAAEQQLVRYRVVQLRSYTHDRHKTVDDYPYGGGAGMVLKPEPFFEAVEDLRVGPP